MTTQHLFILIVILVYKYCATNSTDSMSVFAILIVYPSIPAAPEAIPLEEMSEPVTEVLKPSKTNQEGAILDTLL